MDFDQYVAARRVPIFRAAVLLGVPEESSPAVVDDVLLSQASRIRRAADPDGAVYAALLTAVPVPTAPAPDDRGAAFEVRRFLAGLDPVDRAVAVLSWHADLLPDDLAGALAVPLPEAASREGALLARLGVADRVGAQELLALAAETVPAPALPPLRRPARSWVPPAVAVGAVVVVSLAVVRVVLGPDPARTPDGGLSGSQVPSVYGYRVAWATDLLEERGLRVRERMTPSCDPVGITIGTQPPTGTPVDPGSTVTLLSAFPAGATCQTRFTDRSEAWELLSFAAGQGPAPTFAPEVTVVVDGAEQRVLTQADARDRAAWGDPSPLVAITAALEEVYDVPGSRHYRTPELTADTRRPPALTCGVPRSDAFGGREALVVTLSVPGSDDSLCPLTVEVYRQGGAIDGVVLHPRGGPSPA